jgi:predicted phosphate transport protein (TIGR00153 family)
VDIKEWMTPQEKQFFDDLESEAENVLQGARAFRAIFDDFSRLADHRRRIKDIEHRGDEIVHHIYESLNRAFVTPLAKEDLSGLASKLDDVLDYINGAATRLAVYGIDKPTKAMIDFADLILKAAEQLRAGMTAVRDHKARDAVMSCTIEVNRLENVADDLLMTSLAEVFKSGDPIRIIKLKDIYEYLEIVTDRCEDSANILEDIVVKGR